MAHGIDANLAENPNARFPRLTYGKSENNTQPLIFGIVMHGFYAYKRLHLTIV